MPKGVKGCSPNGIFLYGAHEDRQGKDNHAETAKEGCIGIAVQGILAGFGY